MNDKQIKILKNIVKKEQVIWSPDSETAHRVKTISTHAEEGDDEPCAIFFNGKYAALYNSCFSDFFIIKELPYERT